MRVAAEESPETSHRVRRALWLFALPPLLASCGSILEPGSGPHTPPPPAPPGTTAPRYAAFVRGREDTLAFDAQDANGDPIDTVEANLAALPAGTASFATAHHPAGDNRLRCTLRWMAGAGDTGLYRVTFTAVNDLRGKPDSTLLYTVGHDVDRPPVVACPDTLHLVAGVPRTISVSAEDQDGDPVFEIWPDQVLSTSLLLPINLLSWEPSFQGSQATATLRLRVNRAGTYAVSFQAINAARGFATTRLYVSAP